MSRKKPELTPSSLFAWADGYARRKESSGDGTQYPTVRQAARRFRTTVTLVIAAVEDNDFEDGYLGIASGVRTGRGVFSFKNDGEKLVEAYR